MKYVLVRYGNEQESGFKRLMRRMGVYKKYDICESFISETEGYIFTLPFLEEETAQDYDYCLSRAKKGIERIKDEQGDFVLALPEELRALGGRNGLYTSALAAVLNFVKLTEKRDLKYAKVIICGMDIKAVTTVLEGMYGAVNSLCVFAPADEGLTRRAKEIYCETGLDIIFITNIKSTFFTEADIVINCGMDISGGVNAVKKEALYICLCGRDNVLNGREDTQSVDLSRLILDGEELTAAEAEAVLCARTYAYRNFCTSKYYRDKAERAAKAAERLDLRR